MYGFRIGEDEYFYKKNLQGDITDIYHEDGTKYASYEYDAWGNCTITLDTNGIGTLNPFRYRGYYYDTETNLYYLKSRYYDPAVGRFLNQDVVVGANRDITTYNLFAYCGNNPVSRYDVGGTRWKAIIEGFLDALNERAIEMGIDTAAVGAFLLNMDADEKGIYHASQDCWQQYAGYNDFYDFAFDVGTDMDVKKFPFSYNGKNYMIWAWKGDYINLGAGAEIGIYTGNDPHWFVDTSLAMPMSLSLDYKGENIISYTDGGDQWWCTAFNPNYLNVKASDLTATFRLTFKSEKMYSAFKKAAYKGWTFNDRRLTARFVF